MCAWITEWYEVSEIPSENPSLKFYQSAAYVSISARVCFDDFSKRPVSILCEFGLENTDHVTRFRRWADVPPFCLLFQLRCEFLLEAIIEFVSKFSDLYPF